MPDSSPSRSWRLGLCAPLRILTSAEQCGPTADLEDLVALQGDVAATERGAAEGAGAIVGDVAEVICPSGTCATYQDGTWVWGDWAHLTVDGALKTTPVFAELLTSAAV